VYWYSTWWHDDGTIEKFHDALRIGVRQAEDGNAQPSAGPIDPQSVGAADSVPAATSGFDAGKKTKGRNRFIFTDTLGLLLAVHVVAASVQDRDDAKRPLPWTRLDHPTMAKSGPTRPSPAARPSGPQTSCAARWTSSANSQDSTTSRSSPNAGR